MKDKRKNIIRKRYAINFDKFFEMVTKKSQNEKNFDSQITEIWQPDADGDLKIANKEMVDTRYDVNNSLCSLRYDFLNGTLNQILSVYMTPDGRLLDNADKLSFGQRIIFESFLKEGVIYEIKD